MQFTYKCPICKANNTLTQNNLTCRRCKSDLTSIYNVKKKKFFNILKAIINIKIRRDIN